MTTKQRLVTILNGLLHHTPVQSVRDKFVNKQLIKYISPNDDRLPQEIGSLPLAAIIRIEAKDESNADAMIDVINKEKSQLGVISVHKLDRPMRTFEARITRQYEYPYSVLIKQDSRHLLEETLFPSDVDDAATSTGDNSDSSLDLQNRNDKYWNVMRRTILEEDLSNIKRAVVEFSSPNIAKPFHYGHLKSTILGNYISNLYTLLGIEVTRLNYLGDWGTQFGLLGLQMTQSGCDLSQIEKMESPVRELVQKYVEANLRAQEDEAFFDQAKEYLSSMEMGADSHCEDGTQLNLWARVRELSLKELESAYCQLGISFDVLEFESDYAQKARSLVSELLDRKLASRLPDGAVVAEVEKNLKPYEVTLSKSDGTSLYLGRDLAAALARKERFEFDRMLYVAGADQERHFHSLKEILRKMGAPWHDQLLHVKTGKVIGLSTRSGTALLLSDLIKEASSHYLSLTKGIPTSKLNMEAEDAEEQRELEAAAQEVAQELALSAYFFNDLRFYRMRNYEFDWNRILHDGPGSGVNLQASHARLCSLVERSHTHAGLRPVTQASQLHADGASCRDSIHLLGVLNELDCALHQSYWSLETAPLIAHTIALCHAANKARQSQRLRVLGEQDAQLARTRLSLFECARNQLALLMKLIGLRPLLKI